MKDFVILITGIGTTTSLSVIKGIRKQKDYEVKIIGVDASDFVTGKYFVDKFYKIPLANEVRKFRQQVKKIILKEGVNLVIPIVDYEFPLWNDIRNELQTRHIKILISDHDTLQICTDKYESIKFLEKIGVPTIKTYDSISGVKEFPLFIKPKKLGRSSIDAYKVENEIMLKSLVSKLKNNFILQDFIEGKEYTADCLSDLEGNFICCVVRHRVETKSGISIKGEIVRDKKAADYCQKIVNALKIPGVCNIQFFKNKNRYYFSDINPRFAGAHAFTIEAGLNSIKYIMDFLCGREVKKADIVIKYGLRIMRFWDEIAVERGKVYKSNFLNL